MSLFQKGFRAMLPISTGVIPFGAVMGTVASEASLSFFQSTMMNLFVFAGAAQLATVDLMRHEAAAIVILMTALIINLRFLLYSAAIAPLLEGVSFWKKLLCAHWITDQNYAVMISNEKILKTPANSIEFYLGASLCMFLAWHLSVMAGFIFGNFAPASWNLDFAVPLSFISLVIPTLKNNKYVIVAVFSGVVSLLLADLPLRTGLLATAFLGLILAAWLTRRRVSP